MVGNRKISYEATFFFFFKSHANLYSNSFKHSGLKGSLFFHGVIKSGVWVEFHMPFIPY